MCADTWVVYVAIDLLLIAGFAAALAVRGHRWWRLGQASDHRFVQRELEAWFDRILVAIDSVETPPTPEDSHSGTL